MYKNNKEEMMKDSHLFHTTDPLNFPDSFFSTVDEFGDPFVNQVHDACGASASQVHGDEPSQAPRVKRRKVEIRKVINVPVPKESSDAEFVVPTDVWSWRKYGQKPIKGSPYPRGYYKCSGAKNCTAQKQVERSQTDRNMIIVTYISEHNHPCPAQKNSNVSKKKPSSNSIGSTPKETIKTGISSVVNATAAVTVAAKTDEPLERAENRVELENVITSSKYEGHELDQVFENISVDPLMGVMEGWDEIFPCFNGLEDQNGLIMSNEFLDEEWRID